MLASSAEHEEVPFMVLQCKSCRAIVGDTSTLLSLQKEALIITLIKKSPNVVVDEDLETSKESSDYGSTFNNIFCKNCNDWLGRCYRTTTPELDNLRGNYTFGMGQLILFEIETTMSESQVESQRPIVKSYVDSVEIVKLQKFVVALYDRIEQLELENDSIRNELSSILARSASQPSHLLSFDSTSKAKTKRIRTKKVESIPSVKMPSFPALISVAAALAHGEAESIDSISAMEIVSWSILNGRNPSAAISLFSETKGF